jgi:hypothetical protein
MWTYDLAREQFPTLDHLRRICDLTRDSGFNALGFYTEHRFAYPSTPWSHGVGAVTPEMVQTLQDEYREIMIIPFVNLLGHFEGMIYTEHGRRYAEEKFAGMQADPSNPEFVELAHRIVDDTLAIFNSPIIHIGGDETWQLAACAKCKERVAQAEASGEGVDGKAVLYGEHFGPLARKVLEAGRRPGVWGDMFFDHPQALDLMPKETLIFDWQYFKGPGETVPGLMEKGFEVVCCPALHTYNATWLHIPQSEKNVREHAFGAREIGAFGVCVTTWENALMGAYDTLFPALRACGRILGLAEGGETEAERGAGATSGSPAKLPGSGDVLAEQMLLYTPPSGDYHAMARVHSAQAAGSEAGERVLPGEGAFLAEYERESAWHRDWARLMGQELQGAGGTFAFTGIRSSLKVRLLLNSNPFLAWLHHADELSGEVGDKALAIVDEAIRVAPDGAYRGVSEWARSAIDFVRYAEQAHQGYAAGLPGVAVASLAPARQVFENLEKIARATHLRIGGSLADVERCRVAREHVERVMRRITDYGDGSLGYLPSFEHLTHPKFMPHDQAAWWLINRWANQ